MRIVANKEADAEINLNCQHKRKIISALILCRNPVEARIGHDQYGQKGFLVALKL
jgi:hypothetical protein